MFPVRLFHEEFSKIDPVQVIIGRVAGQIIPGRWIEVDSRDSIIIRNIVGQVIVIGIVYGNTGIVIVVRVVSRQVIVVASGPQQDAILLRGPGCSICRIIGQGVPGRVVQARYRWRRCRLRSCR